MESKRHKQSLENLDKELEVATMAQAQAREEVRNVAQFSLRQDVGMEDVAEELDSTFAKLFEDGQDDSSAKAGAVSVRNSALQPFPPPNSGLPGGGSQSGSVATCTCGPIPTGGGVHYQEWGWRGSLSCLPNHPVMSGVNAGGQSARLSPGAHGRQLKMRQAVKDAAKPQAPVRATQTSPNSARADLVNGRGQHSRARWCGESAGGGASGTGFGGQMFPFGLRRNLVL